MASADTWRRAIAQAHDGLPFYLLELLLQHTSERSTAVIGPDGQKVRTYTFEPLPDDFPLRLAIVRALMFGPWVKAIANGDVTTVDEVALKSGWGRGKPRLNDREVSFVAAIDGLLRTEGCSREADELLESNAHAYGMKSGESLKKRVQAYRRKHARKKPPE
jgi:hypothetical protein